MQENHIIDFSFTMSQLSGNKELALKMLGHFKQEYVEGAERVSALLQAQNLTEAKQLVHTLKGVTGNLGIKALHEHCKLLETAIKDNADIEQSLASFSQSLSDTLLAIDALMSSDANSHETPEETDPKGSSASQRELVALLKRNEFVPADTLTQLMAGIDLSSADKQKLKNAIDDLDYPEALTLLGEA